MRSKRVHVDFSLVLFSVAMKDLFIFSFELTGLGCVLDFEEVVRREFVGISRHFCKINLLVCPGVVLLLIFDGFVQDPSQSVLTFGLYNRPWLNRALNFSKKLLFTWFKLLFDRNIKNRGPFCFLFYPRCILRFGETRHWSTSILLLSNECSKIWELSTNIQHNCI